MTGCECDFVVGDVDEEVPIPHADAAVAADDFGGLVVERGGFHCVGKRTAVAGCFVCLGRCLGIRHVEKVLLFEKMQMEESEQGVCC